MDTTSCTNAIPIAPVRLKDRVPGMIAPFRTAGVAVLRLLCEMQVDFETRRWMKNLDDRILYDIGKTRAEVDAAAQKPVWQRS